MYAVFKTGGKQYRVKKDDKFFVEKTEAEVGDSIAFTDIMCVGSTIGAPFVANASITCEVVDQLRDKKIIVFKKNRRKNYRKKQGHRQYKTVLKVINIAV